MSIANCHLQQEEVMTDAKQKVKEAKEAINSILRSGKRN